MVTTQCFCSRSINNILGNQCKSPPSPGKSHTHHFVAAESNIGEREELLEPKAAYFQVPSSSASYI
jgi:hypothetical protein